MTDAEAQIQKLREKLCHIGAGSRVFTALSLAKAEGREPLTLQDIAKITGLSESTIRVKGLNALFHAQLVESERMPENRSRKLYRLKGLSVAHDESDRRR